MSGKNYYDVLGVSKQSSQEEISKAYKKMVIKYHPDKFVDPKEKDEAQTKIKTINEAYNVLKDKDKRRNYDMGGGNPFNNGGGDPFGGGNPFGGSDFAGFGEGSDFFEDIMSFMNGKRSHKSQSRHAKGKDLQYDIELSILEAFEGLKKEVSYQCPVKCQPCDGSGSVDKKIHTCSGCKGTGQLSQRQGFFVVQQTCPYCKGQGETIANPCSGCKGYGVVNGSKQLILNIKAGAYTGMKLQYSGYGEDLPKNGSSGNLIVSISIKDDDTFKINRDKLLNGDLHISFITAILGGKIEFENIDYEKLYIDIPKGCQHDMKLRLGNKGMPLSYGNSARGDLILRCKIILPHKINAEQKELLTKLHSSFSNPSETSKGFFSTLKEKLF